jgi:hypothetical protein
MISQEGCPAYKRTYTEPSGTQSDVGEGDDVTVTYTICPSPGGHYSLQTLPSRRPTNSATKASASVTKIAKVVLLSPGWLWWM